MWRRLTLPPKQYHMLLKFDPCTRLTSLDGRIILSTLVLMTDDDTIDLPGTDHFLALEHAVWAALCAGDPEADKKMLAADFLGIYPSGFADRGDHAAELTAGPTVVSYDLDQIRLMPLGVDRGMLCYRARYTRPGRQEADEMYVSSLWERRADGWLNVFSQDTPSEPRSN